MIFVKDKIKEYNDKVTELTNQGKGLSKVAETNWYTYINSFDDLSEELKELHEATYKLETGKENTLFITANPLELTIPEMINNRDAIDAHLTASFNKVKPVGAGNITNFIANLKNADTLVNIKDIVLDSNEWNKKRADFLDAELMEVIGGIPQLPEPSNVDIDGTTLTWNPVPGAEAYEISWDLVTPGVGAGSINSIITTDLEIDLAEVMHDKGAEAGDYLVKISALGKEGESLNSTAAEINFTLEPVAVVEPEEFMVAVESANNNYAFSYYDETNNVWEVYHVQGGDGSSDLTWNVPNGWTTTQDLTNLAARTVFNYTNGTDTVQVTYLPVGRLTLVVDEHGTAELSSWDKPSLDITKSWLIDIENAGQWYKINAIPDTDYELDEITISSDGAYGYDSATEQYTFTDSYAYVATVSFKEIVVEPIVPGEFALDVTSTGGYATEYEDTDNGVWEVYHVQGTDGSSADITFDVPSGWTTTQDLTNMTGRTVFTYTDGIDTVQVTYLPVGRLTATIGEEGTAELIAWDSEQPLPLNRSYLIDIENPAQWYELNVKDINSGYKVSEILVTGGTYTNPTSERYHFTESTEYNVTVTFELE